MIEKRITIILIVLILPTLAYSDEQSQDNKELNTFCKSYIDASLQKLQLLDQSDNENKINLVKKKMDDLDVAQKNLDDLIKYKKKLSELADNKIANIYSKIKPENAANQLQSMDIEFASSIIMKLPEPIAAKILTQMDPSFSSKIIRLIKY